MRAVTLYRLSGLAVLIGMTIVGIASVFYSRASGTVPYLDPLVPLNDLAKLFGSLIFLIGLPGLYASRPESLLHGVCITLSTVTRAESDFRQGYDGL